jgi:hypothetical protein
VRTPLRRGTYTDPSGFATIRAFVESRADEAPLVVLDERGEIATNGRATKPRSS